MDAEAIKLKVEKLLERADMASMDKNTQESALRRAAVWIQYYEAQARIEKLSA